MEIKATTAEVGAIGFMEIFAEHGHHNLWRRLVQHPRPDEFAASLAELFFGNPAPPARPGALTEPFFTLGELRVAISKLKHNKGNDDAGLVPELWNCAPDCLLSDLLLLYNDVLYSGDLPPPW